MAKFNVGDKVLIPGTIVSATMDETGDYYEVKVKTNNKLSTFHCEEEDLIEKTETTTPTDTTTPTEDITSSETTEP